MCPVTEADGHDQTTADLEMPDESPSAGVGIICYQHLKRWVNGQQARLWSQALLPGALVGAGGAIFSSAPVPTDFPADGRRRSTELSRNLMKRPPGHEAARDLLPLLRRKDSLDCFLRGGAMPPLASTMPKTDPAGLPRARPISPGDQPSFHLVQSSRFCSADKPGRPMRAMDSSPETH